MGEAAEIDDTNALRRKASVGHRAREVEGLSPTRGLRLSLARAAGDLWELPLSVTGIRNEMVSFEDLGDRLDDEMMLLLLDGPEALRGAIAVNRGLLTSVTEVQTLGEVTSRDFGDRAFTATDAAMFAPLLDATLERLDMMLAGSASAPGNTVGWILGYRYGALVENVRNLTLALEGQEFHLLQVDVDVAAGMRRGRMVLVLPEKQDLPVSQDTLVSAPTSTHSESMAMVPADLTAVLPRMTLPLSQVRALQVGDELPVDPKALTSVALCGADGGVIARCQLGKVEVMRALRLLPRPGQPAVAPAGDSSFEPTLPQIEPGVVHSSDQFEPGFGGDDASFPDLDMDAGGGVADDIALDFDAVAEDASPTGDDFAPMGGDLELDTPEFAPLEEGEVMLDFGEDVASDDDFAPMDFGGGELTLDD